MKRSDDEAIAAALARFFAAELPADLPEALPEEPAVYVAAAERTPWFGPAFAAALALGAVALGWSWFRAAPAPAELALNHAAAAVPADIVAPGYYSPATSVSTRSERVGGRDIEYTIRNGTQPLGWRPVQTDAGWMAEQASVVWTEVSCVVPESGERITATQPALRVLRMPWPGEAALLGQ